MVLRKAAPGWRSVLDCCFWSSSTEANWRTTAIAVRSASRAGSLLVPEVDCDRAEVGAHGLRVARPQQPREAVDERGQPEVQHLEASVEVVLGGEVLGRNSIHLKMSQKSFTKNCMKKLSKCYTKKFNE